MERPDTYEYYKTLQNNALRFVMHWIHGWLCPLQFKLGIGDNWEGPYARIGFETTAEQDEFILEASQQLAAKGALSPNEPMNCCLDDAEVDELLLMASQALESATEKAQPGTSMDHFSSPVSSTKVQVRKLGVPRKLLHKLVER